MGRWVRQATQKQRLVFIPPHKPSRRSLSKIPIGEVDRIDGQTDSDREEEAHNYHDGRDTPPALKDHERPDQQAPREYGATHPDPDLFFTLTEFSRWRLGWPLLNDDLRSGLLFQATDAFIQIGKAIITFRGHDQTLASVRETATMSSERENNGDGGARFIASNTTTSQYATDQTTTFRPAPVHGTDAR